MAHRTRLIEISELRVRLTTPGAWLAALALSALPLGDWAVAADRAPPAYTRVEVSYKIDPRLTRGLYMGDRWVAPRTYSRTEIGASLSIDVRAFGVDALGGSTPISLKWVPEDPEMIAVSPGDGHQVALSVRRAGVSGVELFQAGRSRRLAVRASSNGSSLHVEIDQPLEAKQQAATPSLVLESQKDRISYALGVEYGVRLKRQAVELDAALVARGFQDALGSDEPLLGVAEIKAAMAAYQDSVRARQSQAANRLQEETRKQGEAFLAENKTRDGVVTLPSGLQYRVLRAGDGETPGASDQVVCHYRGTLVDGTEFDSSHRRPKPGTFAVERVIKGWSEALQLMPVGSKWQLFIPPALAYGARGTRGIPPLSTLVFDVELLSIQDRSQARQPKHPAGGH